MHISIERERELLGETKLGSLAKLLSVFRVGTTRLSVLVWFVVVIDVIS